MALGAKRWDVIGMVVRRGMTLIAAGIVLDILGSLALAQVVRGLVFQVEPVDPLSFSDAAIVLGGAALLACWLPASQATRLDPVIALRHE